MKAGMIWRGRPTQTQSNARDEGAAAGGCTYRVTRPESGKASSNKPGAIQLQSLRRFFSSDGMADSSLSFLVLLWTDMDPYLCCLGTK